MISSANYLTHSKIFQNLVNCKYYCMYSKPGEVELCNCIYWSLIISY